MYIKSEYEGDDMYKNYEVERANGTVELKGRWNGPEWGGVEAIEVKHYMGTEPEHPPKTEAKVLYDDDFVYVIFRVEDRYVRAVAKKYQDSVYQDSCVEFFFTPGEDISAGYFNIEINCGGTMLFSHQKAREVDNRPVSDDHCEKVKIFHSEPKIIEPEKQDATIWIIEYKVPFDVLEKYASVDRPAEGVVWRANFYKCGDATSHPHWLTWSVVDRPTPDFHVPECFGTLEFK
jgi:hypothetical protein